MNESSFLSRLVWPAALLGSFILVIYLATPRMDSCKSHGSPMSPTLANARLVGAELAKYASENSGQFPPEGEDANGSLRILFPDHFASGDENKFHTSHDRFFCRTMPPDGDIEGEHALAPGENHWAYVAGLKATDPKDTPILAEGFTAPGHCYDRRHCFYKSKKAIVVYLDGTVRTESLRLQGDTGYVPAPNGKGNLFDPENLPPGAVVLNPALPTQEPNER